MKGILNVNGLIVKYKTKYYKTHQMILNHEALDVKYKIIGHHWLYRRCEVARKNHYFYSPCEEEYNKMVEYFNGLLNMSKEELEKILVDIIQENIDDKIYKKACEIEARKREKSFSKKFN